MRPWGVGVGAGEAVRTASATHSAQLHGFNSTRTRAGAAAHEDLAHAIIWISSATDGVGHVVHLPLGHHVGGHGEDENRRFRRVDLAMLGFCGRYEGNWLRAALMEACTSRAAASMLRLRSNCIVTEAEPSELDEVI